MPAPLAEPRPKAKPRILENALRIGYERAMELTVCVCVRDGAAHLERCLAALTAEIVPYPADIVVIDHDSRDATPRILEAWAARHPGQIRTLPFRGSGIAAARDFAWRQATSPWVAFIDSDCEVQPGWADAVFEAMRRHAGEPDCAAFGGRNRVPQDGRLLYRAYALVLATYVGGHDSILNRPFAESRRVEHCPTLNVVYRRSALEEIAGFDPAYVAAGEDLEVTRRLRARGYSLWAHPGMVVEHALRPTLASWLRNMFVYGRGRCFHSKRHPEDAHPKFLAPLAVGLAYMMSAAAGPAGPVLVGTLHAAGVAALLLPESRRQRASIATYTSAVAITCMTHLAYAAGMLAELPRRKL